MSVLWSLFSVVLQLGFIYFNLSLLIGVVYFFFLKRFDTQPITLAKQAISFAAICGIVATLALVFIPQAYILD